MGLLLAVVVYSAGIQDRVGVRAFLVRLFLRFECLKTVFVNGGYSGRLINRALSMFGMEHAGDQALPAAHLQGASQALDCGKNLCLAESIEKVLRRL